MRDRPIGVIGAGRVGTALGLGLIRAGYEVAGIAARSEAARERAERILPGTPVLDPAVVAEKSGILLLTVADDGIGPLTENLASGGHLRAGQYVMHASGACGLAVLGPAAAVGAVPRWGRCRWPFIRP
ncbi:NAD(P)-binding domain-containing protein [Streptomyces hirsutus]|uniref:NAD(P)-binding domain-containing protein n=1 Tax=Streptomyces hirsutus TaxID=35620 RepID=UPI0036959FA0